MLCRRSCVPVFLLIACAGCSRQATTPQSELDKKFEEMMKGVTLVGRSSRQNSDKISGEEKYVIERVSKVGSDTWLFRSRMQIGGGDVPLPIPVTIKWAGDTPVITLTDMSIPGVGTYTARVLLYRDQYAGTWSGKNGGGQMFGRIVRNQKHSSATASGQKRFERNPRMLASDGPAANVSQSVSDQHESCRSGVWRTSRSNRHSG